MPETKTKPALGVIFHPRFPPETLGDYARRAEAAGFDELWLWDDCFLPGALTSAAIALAATARLRVGIGLMPATVYNPLFAAMEITTLARAFPGRIMPGFGHGVGSWMAQIGAAPKSSMKALEETVTVVRRLLAGDEVTFQGEHVHLDHVQMTTTPREAPPIFVGAMRAKSLQLAGRVGDGTLLTSMVPLAYQKWAGEQIRAGMLAVGREHNRVVAAIDVKVSPDGAAARAAMRRTLAERLPWPDVYLNTMGITEEFTAFVAARGAEGVARDLPDAWLDAVAAAGTPEHVRGVIEARMQTGIDALILQPMNGDADALEEYVRYLLPK